MQKIDRELFKTAVKLGAFTNWLDKLYPIPAEYAVTFEPHFGLFKCNCNGLVTVNKKKKTALVEVNVSQPTKKALISYAHEHCHMRQFIVEGLNPTTYTPGMLCIKAEAWANAVYKKYTQELKEKKRAKSKN